MSSSYCGPRSAESPRCTLRKSSRRRVPPVLRPRDRSSGSIRASASHLPTMRDGVALIKNADCGDVLLEGMGRNNSSFFTRHEPERFAAFEGTQPRSRGAGRVSASLSAAAEQRRPDLGLRHWCVGSTRDGVGIAGTVRAIRRRTSASSCRSAIGCSRSMQAEQGLAVAGLPRSRVGVKRFQSAAVSFAGLS